MGLIKRLIKKAVAIPWLWRVLTGRRWREQVVILMYHKVVADSPDVAEVTIRHFNQHLNWLQKTFDIITPEQFVALDRSRPFGGKPMALLTFDDAFISIKHHVYPCLKRRGLHGLVFVPSEPVNERDSIWPQVNTDLFLYGKYQQLPSFETDESTLAPSSRDERVTAEAGVRKRLKKMPNPRRREAMAKLRQAANWDASQLQPDSRLMNWDDLRSCADVFSYGGHTHTHPIMSSQTREAQQQDVTTCVDFIQQELGVAPLLFAYPNGEPSDFNSDSIAVLREAGYQWAFTTQEGLYHRGDDPMTIKRLPTWAPDASDLAWIIFTA